MNTIVIPVNKNRPEDDILSLAELLGGQFKDQAIKVSNALVIETDIPEVAAIFRKIAGSGSRLMQVVGQLGIDWRVVRTWSGNKALERKLKNQHNAPRLCPVCQQLKKGANQCLK